ncbi:uncharacterized protein si:ch211-139g16.8 isoform X1 [Sebastes umbrosus]|uniref:uncharacterized protein si:ch211-139g16.8 isoform X1 n=1 Tax=Sebastes umbrosus TaxID=72105 RepID=UPI00189C68DB|nr:uncharacterized protein si:ch211-139g16.8 isoform X1 [Sebastes umbrosus]
MDRLFWFSLLLTYLPVTESTKKEESCLIQQHEVVGYIGQSAVLSCTVRSDKGCSAEGLNYEWFTYKKHDHIRLNLSSNSHKYILNRAFLHIKSLHTNDSGVYYCAAASSGDPAPGAQHVGLGTPLQVHIKRRPILMWALCALFVLLAIYNLAVVILIIKKYGCNLNVRRRMCKTEVVDKCLIFCFKFVFHVFTKRGKANRSEKGNKKVSVHYWPEKALTTSQMMKQLAFLNPTKKKREISKYLYVF